MNKIKYLLVFIVLLAQSCDTTEPPIPIEPPKAITLKMLDVSCTEAFIKVTANDTILPVRLTINKDEKALFNITLTKPDTVIIDTTLQPNNTYIYQTEAEINNNPEKSYALQVKTLNITSDNYTWQNYEFGGIGGSSQLRDIAIINENNIWAVGAIYADTTGQAYNAVHWNGSEWELKRIHYYGNCSAVEYPPLKAIWAFDETNIIITNGGSIGFFDGNNVILDCGVNPLLTGAINKIWGTSIDDFYVVGSNGNIAHYLMGSWTKIESGTDKNIHNIWEDVNPFTNKSEIICTASIGTNQPGPWTEVFRIKDDITTENLDKTGLGNLYGGIWFKSGIRYYIVGDGLYEKTYKNETKWNNLNENRVITSNYMTSINGTDFNNIFVAGDNGEVLQFNGMKWKSLIESTSLENGIYRRIIVKKNTIVAVGSNGAKAAILVGN